MNFYYFIESNGYPTNINRGIKNNPAAFPGILSAAFFEEKT